MMALALAPDAQLIDTTTLLARRDASPHKLRATANIAASLNVLTCGSVDDGKSTLIGRLLWDTDGLHADQRARLERSPKAATGTLDFSLLVDGLSAEREQGITIDIAWRYLDAGPRRLVIIDSPGHEQYTRNMATGASHADLAILLVDARSGIKEQTRRHAAILGLMGVRRVVLAVNKMDLVGWSETCFAEIRAGFDRLAARFGFVDTLAIPVAAVLGDNIARRSPDTPWYDGPLAAGAPRRHPFVAQPRIVCRFPLSRPARGARRTGLSRTCGHRSPRAASAWATRCSNRSRGGARASGASSPWAGSWPARARGRPSSWGLMPTSTSRAVPCLLRAAANRPSPAASTCGWCGFPTSPLQPSVAISCARPQTLSRLPGSMCMAISTLRRSRNRQAASCAANDIALARIDLGRRWPSIALRGMPATGSFMLVDPINGASVAGGVVAKTHGRETATTKQGTFRLTRDLVARGLGADLDPTDRSAEEELRRRADEVAILLRSAGVVVELDDTWGQAGIDTAIVWQWLVAILSFGFVGAVLLGLL